MPKQSFQYIIVLGLVSSLLTSTDASANFLGVSNNSMYVLKGGTANLTWSYYVGNRSTEFDTFSPCWFFQDNRSEQIIGCDNGYDSWKFQLFNSTCPPRLLRPTVRVSRQDQATLFIQTTTMNDTGVYGCRLGLRNESDKISTVELIVTETPRFVVTPNSTTTVVENYDVLLNCSAIGPPVPNITWLHSVTKTTIKQGLGSAVILLSKVNRSLNGETYECQAMNNPNECPVNTNTTVIVYYPPVIYKSSSSTNIASWNGNKITLRCKCSSSNPAPTWTWYRPNSELITSSNVQSSANGSEVTVVTGQDSSDYGQYVCMVTNGIASADRHYITVTQLYSPKIDKSLSSTNITSWKYNQITLRCKYSTGQPVPSWKWYRPNGQRITTNIRSISGGSEATVMTGQDNSDYGRYACTATNAAGTDRHAIIVTQLFPPGQCANVSFTNKTTVSATIRWKEPTYIGGSPVTGYKITISSKIFIVRSKPWFYTVTGLIKDRSYEVKVYAKNVVGYGKAVSLVFRTRKQDTPGSPVITSTTFVPPASINLTWTKPDENSAGITNYTIYKKAGVVDNEWKQDGQRNGSALTYTVKNLKPATTYRFIVTATNAYGESVKDDGKVLIVVPICLQTTSSTLKTDPEPENYQVAVVGASLGTLFVISFAVNFLFAVYVRRNKKPNKTTKESAYDNVEMSTAVGSSPHINRIELNRTDQPGDFYEPVGKPRTKAIIPPNKPVRPNQPTIPNEFPAYATSNIINHSNEDQYQQLNPATLQHDPTVQYEPLRIKHVTGTNLRNEMREPPSHRSRPAEYQNFRMYSNVNNASFS